MTTVIEKDTVKLALKALELSRACHETHMAAAMCTAPRVSAERMILEHLIDVATHNEKLAHAEAESALREALAEQPAQQEPVNRYCRAGMCVESDKLHEVGCTAHCSPPLRPWVDLTEEEILACDPSEECWGLIEIARTLEAKLREKNST